MKRGLLIVAFALIIPSILAASPITVGVYYEGGLTCMPPLGPGMPVPFEMHLYMLQSEYNMTAIEYSLAVPALFSIQGWTLPATGQAELGDPIGGHSVTYWPPLNGFPAGYDLLVTYECVVFAETCEQLGWNSEIVVTAHPDTGFLRGTYVGGEKIGLLGLTSYLCPQGIGTEEESWGAIKALYR